MTEIGSARTLGDLLLSRRRHRFVGRASEIELFQAALDSAEPPFSVLHVPDGEGATAGSPDGRGGGPVRHLRAAGAAG